MGRERPGKRRPCCGGLRHRQPAAKRRSLPTAGQQGRPALARRVLLPQAGLEALLNRTSAWWSSSAATAGRAIRGLALCCACGDCWRGFAAEGLFGYRPPARVHGRPRAPDGGPRRLKDGLLGAARRLKNQGVSSEAGLPDWLLLVWLPKLCAVAGVGGATELAAM
jgi:hypothetical protein